MRTALAAWLALAAPALAVAAERLVAGPADGRIVVHAYKAGLLSAFAHDHHFAVTEWTASADVPGGDPGRASVEVVLSAASLHDTQPRLSDEDRRKVDAQAAGPDVLDAVHHPRLTFRSERVELASPAADGAVARGTLHGTLSARGRTVPVDVAFEAAREGNAWRVSGTAHLKQTDLGVKPFDGFGGTVKVKDELAVELAFTLRPGSTP